MRFFIWMLSGLIITCVLSPYFNKHKTMLAIMLKLVNFNLNFIFKYFLNVIHADTINLTYNLHIGEFILITHSCALALFWNSYKPDFDCTYLLPIRISHMVPLLNIFLILNALRNSCLTSWLHGI